MSDGLPKNQIRSRNSIEQIEHEDDAGARRVVLVNSDGSFIGLDKPLAVRLSDGSINIDTLNADLRVNLSAKDDYPKPGDVHSSVRIANQNYELNINPDGSINVNVVVSNTNRQVVSYTNEAAAVPAGSQQSIVSYTVPNGLAQAFLQRITVSGDNIAKYSVYVNNALVETKRTYFGGSLDATFEYSAGSEEGLPLSAGDEIVVKVLHNRPFVGDFDARIQVVQIS